VNFFLSSRWSVRLALIIIALLALIALTSQWWLAYEPPAIDLAARLLRRACFRRMRSTGWAPIT